MSQPQQRVETTVRIPGNWVHPGELLERLPSGYRLSPESLHLPDGSEVKFSPLPPDEQFPEIFRSSCRRPATDDELAVVDSYTVNVCLSGPGGSLEAAQQTMQAAAAIVRAGGAGVFIDNSALAHGGDDWIEMTEDAGPDALSFAFTAIVRGRDQLWTMGMHVLGQRDILMQRADADQHNVIDLIRYLAANESPIDDGHFLGDETKPTFRVRVVEDRMMSPDSPMYNPFGRLQLINLRDIAERN